MSEYQYNLDVTPLSYATKIAPDILDGAFLVAGSQNCLIADDGTVESRKGYTLHGQAGTGYFPIQWANKEPWLTNTGVERNMRTQHDIFQVWYNNYWHDVKRGFGNNVRLSHAEWFDRTEGQDKFLFVNGTTKIYSWQGGIAEVDTIPSSTTIKKKDGATPAPTKVVTITGTQQLVFGYQMNTQNNTVINSVAGVDGADNFWDKGFRVGDQFTIAGLGGAVAGNNGAYTIFSINRDTNELLVTTPFSIAGTSTGAGTVTATTNAYGTSGKTFYQARFPSTGTRRFIMLGVVYTYTGGHNTDTLTGITPALPASVPAGTLMFSDIYEDLPTGGDIPSGNPTFDVCAVSLNELHIGSSIDRRGYISKQDNFKDFGYTVPIRKAGEGGSYTLDQNIVAIFPNEKGVVNVSCGQSIWYDITLKSVTSSGVEGEEVVVERSKIALGQGAISREAIANTKNGAMFLSAEPSVDYLSRIKTSSELESVPLSDAIKPDLAIYNKTDAVSLYYRNYFLCMLPKEGVLLMFDLERKIWQPPQLIDANTMSIINSTLVFHSASRNESYNAFTGTNDNGVAIPVRINNVYKNGQRRDRPKIAYGYFVEARLTRSTTDILWQFLKGYYGSQGVETERFGADDGSPFVEIPASVPSVGGFSVGGAPVGALFSQNNSDDYLKYRRVFPIQTNGEEFFEAFCSFFCDELDANFKIIAHGADFVDSGSNISEYIKQ